MNRKLIYVVDDEENIRRLLEYWIGTKWEYRVALFPTGEDCLNAMDDEPDLVILDIQLPGIDGIATLERIRMDRPHLPVFMLSAQGSIDVAVSALRLGATDYFPKTVDMQKLEVAIRNALELGDLARENQFLREQVRTSFSVEGIVTSGGGGMEGVVRLIHKARDSAISVLIEGESGTGKELVARAIHFNGRRSSGPFVAVNCAAIPHELLESEMFGHEKGAFTGATARKIGRFEQAHGGTIFLDEIGELDLNVQAKLLRVLQEREIQRVGGDQTIKVDVRIVSATNRNLLKRSRDGSFREDLYYRLGTFPIHLPPLRERREDILPLAEHFLTKFSEREGRGPRGFTRQAVKLIYDYPWPGNVRELEGAIERGVLMCEGATMDVYDLPMVVRAFADGATPDLPDSSIFANRRTIIPMEQLKEEAMQHALEICNGNVSEAAQRLGISRSTMYEMAKRYRRSHGAYPAYA